MKAQYFQNVWLGWAKILQPYFLNMQFLSLNVCTLLVSVDGKIVQTPDINQLF